MGEKVRVGCSGRGTGTQFEARSWLEIEQYLITKSWPKPEDEKGQVQGMKRWHSKCKEINLNLKYFGAKVQFYIRQTTKQYIWRVLFAFVPHCPDLLLLWFCTTCLLSRIVYLFQYCAGLFRWLSQHDRLSYLSGFICWEPEFCKKCLLNYCVTPLSLIFFFFS